MDVLSGDEPLFSGSGDDERSGGEVVDLARDAFGGLEDRIDGAVVEDGPVGAGGLESLVEAWVSSWDSGMSRVRVVMR